MTQLLGHKWEKSSVTREGSRDDREMVGLGGRRLRRKWQLLGALCAMAILVSTTYVVRAITRG
ncbi:hypothetical protein, partial [Streptomyces sp. NPDC127574]